MSTPQPDPGFFRAMKVGRCSDIPKITACNVDIKRLLHGNDRFSALEVAAKYQRSLKTAPAIDLFPRYLVKETAPARGVNLRPSFPGWCRVRPGTKH
jgi:hypothetical protein